ncbi:type VII secretion-associated serine protease mycosin [Actinoplanes tereljensis]|uniref:Type VII secretion-associated serine protease n=1 Tax=Paractinoplanes tereljensis TaxID=571912 RepID=A0A919NSW8_9ACTN|nr:S8 family serine peptidase [Actinoplanes tereljensis]GIF24564.1 type VII secretion-associated serine protease [Actinoplanes tereljensis]
MIRRSVAALAAALLAVLVTAVPARADAQRDAEWYLEPMKAAQAAELGRGGDGVIVAVLDTGVDTRHPDLAGATVPGRNMALDKADDNLDPQGHGTGTAVLISGRGHGSGAGLLGIAPKSKVMPIRPIYDAVLVAEGIRWAVQNGAKVINMSFELDSTGSVQQAIDEAVAADVVVVACTGNENTGVGQPASLRGVLAVGAVDRTDQIAKYSNHGPETDLVAYGTGLPVAQPRGKYAVADGTSSSAALVAGAAALIRARYPDMPASEVVDRLTSTATDRGEKGRDDYYGYGQLNLIAALTAPRTSPSASAAAPVTQPVSSTPDTADQGFPPLLTVAIGVLLLILAVAAFMIVRARRNT